MDASDCKGVKVIIFLKKYNQLSIKYAALNCSDRCQIDSRMCLFSCNGVDGTR